LSYSMTVTDYAGNSVTRNSGATGSVTVDRTPPTVHVASAGNKTIGRYGETISFTATFVDTNGIDETTAPRIIIGGSSHTMTKSTNLVWTYDYPVPTGDSAPSFAVTIDATDVAGNDNAVETGVQSVIVDTTRPTTSLTSPALPAYPSSAATSITAASSADVSATYYTTGTSITFAWAGADTSSGIAGYYVDGTFTADTDGSASVPLAASATAHVVYVVDNAGNESYRLNITVTQDTHAPELTSIGAPSGAGIHFNGSSTYFTTAATLSFNPTATDTDTGDSGLKGFNLDGTTTTVALPLSLSAGASTHTIYAVDHVGRITPSAAITVTRDQVRPTTSLTSPATGVYPASAATSITATSEANVSATYYTTGDSVTFAWAGADTSSGIAGYYVDGTFTADTDGSASIELAASATAHVVYAVDRVGNESYRMNVTVTKDTTRPTTSLTSPALPAYPSSAATSITAASSADVSATYYTTGTSITFAWAGADTSSGIAGYYVDGTFTADTDGSASVPLAASATAHVVYVVDNAGNESYRLNITVTQDTDKPTIGSDSLVDADYPTVALRTNGTMTLTFTPTDTGSGISRYTVEGACSSVAVTSGLTSGSPVERGLSGITASGDIVLTVYDGVGNNETKTYTVTFDNSPPANVTGFTATANAGSSITLKWTDPTASDFDHVHISWTINGSAGSSADIEAEEEEYTISDLTENDVVVFTVSTVDTIGNASSGDVMGGSTTVLASRYSSQTSSRASPTASTASTASTAFTASTASTAAAAAATTSARPGSRAITSPKATSPETKSASWVTPPTPAGRARSEAVSATTGAARADASTAARAAASSRSEAAEAKAPTTAATASDEPDATPPATVVRHSTAQSVSAAGGSGAAATPSSAASSVAFAGSTVGGPATAAFNGSAQAVADGPGGSNAEAAPTTSGLGMPSDTPDAPRAPDGTGSRRPVQAVMPGRGGCGRRDEEMEGDER
ncbi:MAG TPA: hypothetical protein PLQ29_05060, partial [Spirochaetales bacterium]|nr:hypothetical protein [Spirochaetales bacterium]